MDIKEQIAAIGAIGYFHQKEMGDALMPIRASLRVLDVMAEAGLPVEQPELIITAWQNAQNSAGAEAKHVRFQEFIHLYSEWFLTHVGVSPRIDSRAGKAMNQLIDYLIRNCKAQNEDGAFAALTFILEHWGKLSPFIAKQTSVYQINKNIEEILTQLRNGNTKQERNASATASVRDRIRRNAKRG